MDNTKDSIQVYTGSVGVISVEVTREKRSVPVALEETKDLWSLRDTARTFLTNLLGNCIAFNKSAMLDSRSKEGGTKCFFPKIVICLVPILSYEVQIVRENRPDDR